LIGRQRLYLLTGQCGDLRGLERGNLRGRESLRLRRFKDGDIAGFDRLTCAVVNMEIWFVFKTGICVVVKAMIWFEVNAPI